MHFYLRCILDNIFEFNNNNDMAESNRSFHFFTNIFNSSVYSKKNLSNGDYSNAKFNINNDNNINHFDLEANNRSVMELFNSESNPDTNLFENNNLVKNDRKKFYYI